MNRSAGGSWSLKITRWRGVELRLHIHFPLLALAVLLAASLPSDLAFRWPAMSIGTAALGLGILLSSVLLHELARAMVARRVGGKTNLVVLGPTGGWAHPQLPSDPPAHLVTAVSGPLTYLAILVAAACGLALAGEQRLLNLFWPFAPRFLPAPNMLHLAAQLTVWINTCLLLINLLPIQPFDGAEVLRGLLWPLVGRASASVAAAHIAYGAAAMTAVMAIVVQQQMLNSFLPQWFPLAVLSVLLLYGGNRASRQREYDLGLDIDQWDSDDGEWLAADWLEDDRAPVLVEQVQEKQQEALDRKRREREDREDARVDDILARLQHVAFEELSDEEQAILKRASRRYRERQQRAEGA